MDNLKDIDQVDSKSVTEDVKPLEIIKRGRGRPRTRPIIPEEEKIRKKPGRKGDATKNKEYYVQYYRDHYQNNFTNCPACNKQVQRCKLTKHMRGEMCYRNQINKKYIDDNKQITEEDNRIIEEAKKDFDNFCNYIIQNPGVFTNMRLKKSII